MAGKPTPSGLAIVVCDQIIEDKATKQKGSQRDFISPPLKKDREYTYDIRMELKQGDRVVRQSKTLTFKAGDKVDVEFTQGRPDQASARK